MTVMKNIKHLSKESFIELINFIINDTGINKIYFSQKTPMIKGAVSLMNTTSLDITLSGKKHICFASDGQTQDVFLTPGDIHCSPPLHWKKPLWDSLHEMSSIVYHPDYIRLTYINYNKIQSYQTSHPAAEIFYHTSIPLSITGTSILRALALSADSGNSTGAPELLKALLKITLETLEKDAFSFTGKSHRTWFQIKQYIQEHFSSPINRAHVATVFKLNPSYISRLFNEHGNESFNSMLRRLRLDHAALLLKQTNLTVYEITDACGYFSSTYFISAFHKQFGMSPGKYRLL